MLVDAHHHLWNRARGDYPWMPGAPEILQRDYLVCDLAPLLSRFGIRRTVLIQAAPTQAETDFLLDIAEKTDFVAGVVGWLDMEDAQFASTLSRYAERPKFLGLRPMLQDIADDAWIVRPRVLKALEKLAEQDLTFDFLVLALHLPHVAETLRLVPGLRAVIDHLAKPPIASGDLGFWKDGLARLAEFDTLFCKLSGLITEADATAWSVDDLSPAINHALDVFGPQRLIFGSDWPVCRPAGNYADVLAATMAALPAHLARDPGIFGGNAVRFYGLPAFPAPSDPALSA
ncbi:amidohydrolase family protein [Martelella mediterranea]|uniref:Putative metal-dependent hydrolase of the TIM-barrel fold protein n=1 Tax=Martelella mediterranea DSM 17316 TaxID=1122214 RepID=A0A1U9Z7S6_9HYPH|nr:amidohydrolase family protein [Martelella mediterranea]AQZ53680.1 putative metal-dependent hydrolase of the TIM-barrel fold protein [Martelella mediterranea DSM 17316]